MVVFGAIAPHGDPAFVDGSPTRLAFEELARRFSDSHPGVTVVLTPHNVHVQGSFAVVTTATIAGSLVEQGIDLACAVDRELADEILRSLQMHGLPAVGISFGSNDLALAEMPMDWGTLIPLWFMGGRAEPPVPVVVVSPAREFSFEAHVRAGQAVAVACGDRRVAVIASADSLWQLVMLHGALGDDFRAELLSYERPTYFGMLVAAFEPV